MERVLEGHPLTDVTLEPLDDHVVVETLDESELPSGLIVPANEAAQCRTGIVAAVGPDVDARSSRATRCSSRGTPGSTCGSPGRRIACAC